MAVFGDIVNLKEIVPFYEEVRDNMVLSALKVKKGETIMSLAPGLMKISKFGWFRKMMLPLRAWEIG
jgi:hypothetical protein